MNNVVAALLDIAAVGFAPKNPITFKSGIISPVYVDNRRLPFSPKEWQVIIAAFLDLIEKKGLQFDVIAGIATAGIPHSATLGYSLNKPSVYVRKQAKGHGTKSRIEGGSVKGKKVLLIEDLVTTGGSSLSGVEALREAGAIVSDCLVIISYEFAESAQAFKEAGVELHTLAGFPEILAEAQHRGLLSPSEKKEVESWMADPHSWGK